MISNELKKINIPGFTIIDKLGRGAMAQVYLAIQNALDRKVALKIMADNLLDDPEYSSRFLREAKIVAQLSHPHIVSVYDVGVFQGSHYLSMEYHPGGDLKSKIKRGISLQDGLRIARQLALALNFAHKEGYIHRDVKPENILFDRNDSAILTDFGIARAGNSASDMTAVGTIMGTPKYMSPEQAQGINVDGRADLYSLGIMIFEMLSGHAPYDSDNAIAICHMHINKPIPKLPQSLGVFQALIDETMAKNPADRVSSGDAIVKMLDNLAPFAAKLSDFIVGDDDETLLRNAPTAATITTTTIKSTTGKNEQNSSFADSTFSLLDDAIPVTNTSKQVTTSRNSVQQKNTSVNGSKQKSASKKYPKLALFLLVLIAVAVGVEIKIAPLDSFVSLISQEVETSGKNSDPLTESLEPLAGLPEQFTPISTLTSSQLVETADPSEQKLSLSLGTNKAEKIISKATIDAKPIKTGSIKIDLLDSLQILAPKNQNLCASKSPYKDGSHQVRTGQTLRAGDCFSIKIARHSEVDLIVYSHSEDGTIYRLLPNSCNAMGLQGINIKTNRSIQLPLNANKELAVIGLDDKAGTEWVYAVAVKNNTSRQQVLDRLSSVPDVCSGIGGSITVDEVQKILRAINRRIPNQMQWLSTSFRHVAK